MSGQPEIGKKSKFFPVIPALNNTVKVPLPEKEKSNPFSSANTLKNEELLYTPNNDLFKEKKKPTFVIGENRNSILEPKQAFINPNLDVLDKLNGVGKQVSEGFKEIRGNQDLGNFNSKSKFVNIRYRDFGEVDDDRIRIYLNGHVVAQSVTLLGFYTGLEITLEKGFNKIDFEALNQGTTGPNTAEFQIFDDNKSLISQNQWNLVTGFKASIMIFKD
ncbi:MAG: hypothetical protein H7174_12645 [Flavobacterium sp.]|nr:hypothetical protein [Flavobacterium sp.]